MKLKDKLWCYVLHKTNQFERERDEIRYTLRYRPLDSLDMYEQMRHEIQIECWNEYIRDLMDILIAQGNKP